MNANKTINYTLEHIMGDRFAKFSKYVIQDRALPDVRDGLKPVQRRILYSMYVDGNFPNKPYRKSAKTVGFVMGNYHPHGDSSIYNAMVRMSQNWKQRELLVDMHGNNGSIDEDPAAAMRYTEARLAPISLELLKDIEKDTVAMNLNFDDSLEEPTVLPAKFPNILVNGSKGIAVGMATNIPPHNLNEVIKGTIHRLLYPESTLEDIMKHIKGPDFPTGGIIQGKEGIKSAFTTGSGSFQIISKVEKIEQKRINQMVISEIPYEVVKSTLVARIDKIRNDRDVDGILEVRDESDRTGLRIVIDINKAADYDAIYNFLMRKSDLSVRFSYNLVAICDKKPRQLNLLEVLDYYIEHQKEVVLKRSSFDLKKAETRLHIVDGLIIAVADIDEVIKIIRASKGKEDSKKNLMSKINVTERQAEAIVSLQLYRLNSTDIEALKKEKTDLKRLITDLKDILNDDDRLISVIVDELKGVAKTYASPRLSKLEEDVEEFTIEKRPVLNETVYISATRDGYFKRSSVRSYTSSDGSLPGCKDGDIVLGISEAETVDVLLAFTNKGNYLYIPVHELLDTRWKDEGKHISHLISLPGDEKIVSTILVKEFNDKVSIAIASKNGKIKKTALPLFEAQRYTRPLVCMLLDGENDEVVGAHYCDGDATIVIVSEKGKGLQYHESTVSLIGIRTQGVKALELDEDDYIADFIVINKHNKCNVLLVTRQGGYRIFNPSLLEVSNRIAKPIEIYKYYRTDPHFAEKMHFVEEESNYAILSSLKGAHEITFDTTRAAPLGRSIKATLVDKNEMIHWLSDYVVPVIDKNTKTYEPVEKQPAPSTIKVEDDFDRATIFDFIDDL